MSKKGCLRAFTGDIFLLLQSHKEKQCLHPLDFVLFGHEVPDSSNHLVTTGAPV